MGGSGSRAAVFLDRDGVINVDTGYPHKPEDLQLTPTAARAIALINRSGALAIVVTNQSGVARGMFTLHQVGAFHDTLVDRLAKDGGHLDAIYVAPYHPEGSVAEFAIEHEDRKPGGGMLRKALADWSIDPARSVMIGDKPSDAQAANEAGIAAIIVPSNTCDLAAVVSVWLAEQKMDRDLD
jgi:D-glycero-D-manno-heptose 1,7-bisphosphate phosphatase